jgi:ATP-dependent Clp protease ATP-binding subunit ClpC
VLAQEEARLLGHSYIGTEHLLLGLVHEEDGLASKALRSLDISLAAVRAEVEKVVGPAGSPAAGSPPFTPRAKKVLELSLREALQLGHNYIGTEHILLGLVREGEGIAAKVLVSLGADLAGVRQEVIKLLSGYQGPGAPAARPAGERDDLSDLTMEEGTFAPEPIGDHWTARVVRAGRNPAVFDEAYGALAELVAPFGINLEEAAAERIMVISVLTSGGPGLLLTFRHRTEG